MLRKKVIGILIFSSLYFKELMLVLGIFWSGFNFMRFLFYFLILICNFKVKYGFIIYVEIWKRNYYL